MGGGAVGVEVGGGGSGPDPEGKAGLSSRGKVIRSEGEQVATAAATTRLDPSRPIPHPTPQTAWASPFLVAEVKGRAKKRLPALSRRHSGIPVRSKSDSTPLSLPSPAGDQWAAVSFKISSCTSDVTTKRKFSGRRWCLSTLESLRCYWDQSLNHPSGQTRVSAYDRSAELQSGFPETPSQGLRQLHHGPGGRRGQT